MADPIEVVIASFYTNILVCALIFFTGVTIFYHIVRFSRENRIFMPKIIFLGSFWFFSGLTWFFAGLGVYINGMSGGDEFKNIYDILSFHCVIAFGLSLVFHIFYKNFIRLAVVWSVVTVLSLMAVVYSYLIIAQEWGEPIYSDWGMAVQPPDSLIIFSLVMGVIFVVILMIDFFVRLLKFLKHRTEESLLEFATDLAIVAIFAASMFDAAGTPGWKMVLDRIFILMAALTAYLAIYQTSYLPNALEEERRQRTF